MSETEKTAEPLALNVMFVDVGVNYGDHSQDVYRAQVVDPCETVGELVERLLAPKNWRGVAEPKFDSRIEIRVAESKPVPPLTRWNGAILMSDVLRAKVARAIHAADCGCTDWTEDDEDQTYQRFADAALAVFRDSASVALSPKTKLGDDERDTLIGVLMQHPWLDGGWPKGRCPTCHTVIAGGCNSPSHAEHLADALIAVGFRRSPAVETVTGDTSDGHHTFDELYEYRMLYHAHAAQGWLRAGISVVKSWRHSDGGECFGGGWFIVVATLPSGQVSNHYEAEHWDVFDVPEVELPPEYDGHSPADVVVRLRTIPAAVETVTTVEQVRALPHGTILRGREGQAYLRLGDRIYGAGNGQGMAVREIEAAGLPATLLWTPNENGAQ